MSVDRVAKQSSREALSNAERSVDSSGFEAPDRDKLRLTEELAKHEADDANNAGIDSPDECHLDLPTPAVCLLFQLPSAIAFPLISLPFSVAFSIQHFHVLTRRKAMLPLGERTARPLFCNYRQHFFCGREVGIDLM